MFLAEMWIILSWSERQIRLINVKKKNKAMEFAILFKSVETGTNQLKDSLRLGPIL